MKHVGNAPASISLRSHAQRWQGLRLSEAIAADPSARHALQRSAGPLTLDYARQRLDAPVLADLLALAEQCELPQAISAMCGGQTLNPSEQRRVLHMALRSDQCSDAGVADEVAAERQRMQDFVAAVRQGKLRNAAGQTYTDVINVGIGGSDLGPRLVVSALAGLNPDDDGLRAHFMGNPDSADVAARLRALDARRTLCVVVSKSFTTAETRVVAEKVRRWMQAGGGDVAHQFVAVTSAPQAASEFGIAASQQFAMWSWVGGRFSLWSAVGLSVALALGWSQFQALLAGAATVDEHFVNTPLADNLPVLWALTAIWNRNFLGYASQVTAVYSDRLKDLPDWLQQLDMESNGKSVGRDGSALTHATAPIQWGGVGTTVQHAFFQMLHQGGDGHPVDFVLPLHVPGCESAMQNQLIANGLAQSAALSHGRRAADEGFSGAAAHWRDCPGNRPSSLIWLQQLDAYGLGALLAAYEHRCFVQGWLWGLNSFDQFGVELGKTLAKGIEAGLAGDDAAWPDALMALQAQRL